MASVRVSLFVPGPYFVAVAGAAGQCRTCFSGGASPSSVFILPPTLRVLFSRAGGGKVRSLPCVAASSARTRAAKRSPATLPGSPLLILCARGKRLVSPRARSCVHVGSVRARVHPDGLLWLDNEGKEVSHSSRVAETTRGFPWLLPPSQGVHVLQQAENTQFPGCCC